MTIDGVVQTGNVDSATDETTDDIVLTVDIAPGEVQAAQCPQRHCWLTISVMTENV